MLSIEYLPWDSDFFHRKVGKADVLEVISDNSDHVWDGYDLVYVFSTVEQPELEKYFIETRTKLELCNGDIDPEYHPGIRKLTLSDQQKLTPLVLEAGHESRFKNDPKLESHFEPMYRIWSERILENTTFGMFDDSENLLAFASFTDNNMDLMAVHLDHRRKGLAQKLFRHCATWLSEHGFDRMTLTTQNTNDAMRFYEALNFTAVESKHVYHLHR